MSIKGDGFNNLCVKVGVETMMTCIAETLFSGLKIARPSKAEREFEKDEDHVTDKEKWAYRRNLMLLAASARTGTVESERGNGVNNVKYKILRSEFNLTKRNPNLIVEHLYLSVLVSRCFEDCTLDNVFIKVAAISMWTPTSLKTHPNVQIIKIHDGKQWP
eukprot:GHVN01029184.1.p1 GENE.GHVN01029184.1~~GHVN01029184.1.p1  ORF type:complete len:161 (+),score=21.42 GHVN01029184.1:1723-2205(+)